MRCRRAEGQRLLATAATAAQGRVWQPGEAGAGGGGPGGAGGGAWRGAPPQAPRLCGADQHGARVLVGGPSAAAGLADADATWLMEHPSSCVPNCVERCAKHRARPANLLEVALRCGMHCTVIYNAAGCRCNRRPQNQSVQCALHCYKPKKMVRYPGTLTPSCSCADTILPHHAPAPGDGKLRRQAASAFDCKPKCHVAEHCEGHRRPGARAGRRQWRRRCISATGAAACRA